MKLVQLLYFSRASREMSLADLKSVLESARKNNTNLEVSGMLCYDRRYFLQALEGERDVVNELYLDIADDPRHDEVTIISYCNVEKLSFDQWKMGYASSSAEFNKLLSEMGQQDFLPAEMSEEQAFHFLKHMSKSQQQL
ncbi:BLUF domain-containing protein [Alteromonas sp. BMJM2]|uniref:BLUF domain-containing protein n=1 Tax=Alteromonas sp. BMJM2 TaxID=2954241 RepID=UPI0022B2AE6E|nr:BLUF domain-containing protein [Alteromonas sp. BMJM2]